MRAPGRALFLLSFTALFLELLLIRWVPAAVVQIAYYANLMLLSSFLGLGLGAMVAGRRPLLRLFPALLLLEVGLIGGAQGLVLPSSGAEVRFGASGAIQGHLLLLLVFASNVATFVPLGQRIGELFGQLPPLRAYSWDLLGSLSGTVAYALFSASAFSPPLGLLLVCGLFLLVSGRGVGLVGGAALAAGVAVCQATVDRDALWSPYHYLTVSEQGVGGARAGRPVPPPDLRTRADPPLYQVEVNRFFYQLHGTIDPARTGGEPRRMLLSQQYRLPYALGGPARRVLVLGAGGGLDVEAALLAGAERVDAVEIDPGVVELSRTYSASGAYDRPGVNLILDDARAALERLEPGYDRIVFGYLDSQALFSARTSVRLDGFVYTVEGLRAGLRLLAPGGVMVVSFFVGEHAWLREKLYRMVEEAVGHPPLAYTDGGRLILLASHEPLSAPDELFHYRRVERPVERGDVPLARDDWPYLYLRARTIPLDYALVIGFLALGSVGAVLALRRRGDDPRRELQMFWLGMGFLLLQTKSIGDCSLYFGSTWVVTNVVIAGVLLMVLLANLLAIRRPRLAPGYLPLFAALAVTCAVPREWVLGLPWSGRLAWTLLVVPLPLLFAGLIFSTSFRAGTHPAALFGANLIGATLGGFSEYLGMAIGSRGLSVVLIGAYALSCLAAPRRTS